MESLQDGVLVHQDMTPSAQMICKEGGEYELTQHLFNKITCMFLGTQISQRSCRRIYTQRLEWLWLCFGAILNHKYTK